MFAGRIFIAYGSKVLNQTERERERERERETERDREERQRRGERDERKIARREGR